MFHHDLTQSGYSATLSATSSVLLWNYTTNNPIGASPAIVDGYVYISSDDGAVYCLNALNGSKVWSYADQRHQAVSSSIAVAQGYAYFGCYDRKVYCLNALTGLEVWNFTTGNNVESCPSVSNTTST